MKKKNKSNVLVVDDDMRLLSTLSSILKDNGYRVFTAENGQKAQEALSDSPVDAIILDLVLPDADGIDLLKKFHQEKPLIPVIMLTAHGTISKAVKATRLGAFDFFEKPVESKKILITLENALKSSRLEREKTFLIQDALQRYQMVGISSKMKNLFEMIEKVADTDSRILITGDSGTGKELVAQAIHLHSERAGNPMITVNCSAIPEDLLESELFGHEKGSFTGALRQQKGKFELASSGTLFLDEIGDLGLRIQPKILRAIENGEIQRLGGDDYIKVDVRIIAATNQDLKSAVRRKEFREDLFYRLSVINIHVPSLRERKEDIPLLADYFLDELCRTRKRPAMQLAPAAIEKLVEYPWPGNVRELRNLVEKIAVLSGSELVSGEEMEMYLEESPIIQNPKENNSGGRAEEETLSQILKKKEKEAIEARLLAFGWNYEKAAEELGISRSTLFSKIKEHGIKRNIL
ncbi:MAG: response regulator [Candidatus Aminicenantes bacterium]|nr:response regulator [Candidatus Aminicenantes bacterium]NIM84137.1 response regulator [Candidatus Aminicenantes bacterium]NIN23585.1 response regulator [Candidatus Aminicenantes bacterium]NIN47292.1 response regulator [Candidatus Aminicenantes bacterium]NIN90221.1 response regulator [Candidatus Aminicenantes bacterium]